MSVSITEFGKTTSGVPIQRAVLKNDQLEVQLLTYAAIIHKILVPDRKGNPVDVVLGYNTVADYELNTDSMGAAVGRFCQPHRRSTVSAVRGDRPCDRQPEGQLPAQRPARFQPYGL